MIEKKTLLHHSNSCGGGVSNKVKVIGLCLVLNSGYAWSESCFSIPNILPNTSQDWQKLQESLKKETKNCLESSVFFALYGASQLNSGQLNDAIESLERALLLDANNGAALIDYASALYLSGQLFSAIDLNEQLLNRTDLPKQLKPLLKERARNWQSQTQVQRRDFSIRSGYDDNLNGATFIDSLTLNFPGQDITLPVEENAKAVAGKYIDVSLSQENVSHSAFGQQIFSLKSNFRISENHDSNYFQLAAAYEQRYNQENSYWHWGSSISYLHYNEKPLTLEWAASVKKQWFNDQACEPFVNSSLEYLSVIREHALSSVTAKTGTGLFCQFSDNLMATRINYIQDIAQSNERPGGDSNGWSIDFQWQRPLYTGTFNSNLKYTRLDDQKSYNSLLDNGANRKRQRTDISLEYLHPLANDATLSFMLTKQRKTSNIALFKQRNSRISIGFKKEF